MPDALYETLLDGNEQFVRWLTGIDPAFFAKSAAGQSPGVLWIGCSDSRVPPTQMTSMLPGDIFVHRNIANMVVPSDPNCLSVIEYAVNILKVEHIIVCGHYGCGGIEAVLGGSRHPDLDSCPNIRVWLGYILEVYQAYKDELDEISDPEQRARAFVERNVREQVYSVSTTMVVKNSREKWGAPLVHGWVYEVDSGYITELVVDGC